ncbi:MAG: hypothetical protein AAF483_07450 [Planctomycetota bacterium]
MHALQWIEITANFARHSEACLLSRQPMRKESAHSYWLNCRYRHDVWNDQLQQHRITIQKRDEARRSQSWYEILPTLQEILLSEPLTRCLTHHALVMEEHEVDQDFGALAQSTLVTHTEARQRCLHLIVFGTGLSTEYALRLNRLRKSCENFTDQILAVMRAINPLEEISFNNARTQQIRRQLHQDGIQDAFVQLHCASAVNCFLRKTALDIDYREAHPKQSSRIAETVIGLFPRELFDGYGIPRSIQSSRLLQMNLNSELSDQAPLPCNWQQATNSASKLFSPLDLLASEGQRPVRDLQAKRW